MCPSGEHPFLDGGVDARVIGIIRHVVQIRPVRVRPVYHQKAKLVAVVCSAHGRGKDGGAKGGRVARGAGAARLLVEEAPLAPVVNFAQVRRAQVAD